MFNFPQFARDHRIDHLAEGGHHHAGRGWIQTHCPQCTDGTHGYHLGWSLNHGNMNCWRCGPVRVRAYVQRALGVSEGQVYRILRKYSDGRRGGGVATPPARTRKVKPPPGLEPLHKAHRQYLRGRGFHVSTLVEDWELQGTTYLSGSWNWRIVFPIYNEEEQIAAYLGRSIGNIKTKYKMTEKEKCLEDPRRFLYGIHKAWGDTVIIVEGPTDVWKLGAGTVATLGVNWVTHQSNRLRKYNRKFILFDNEPQAQKRADNLANHLSLFSGEVEVVTIEQGDPGNLTRREARKLKKELGVK